MNHQDIPPIDCDPELGVPPGLGDEGRAYIIINQTDRREAAETKEQSDDEWLKKPFNPHKRVPIKVVGIEGVGVTLGDVLEMPA